MNQWSMNRSIDQSINQSTNQPANQPINQPTSKPANQPTDRPTNRSTNQPTNQPGNTNYRRTFVNICVNLTVRSFELLQLRGLFYHCFWLRFSIEYSPRSLCKPKYWWIPVTNNSSPSVKYHCHDPQNYGPQVYKLHTHTLTTHYSPLTTHHSTLNPQHSTLTTHTHHTHQLAL